MLIMNRLLSKFTLFPYTTLFRSWSFHTIPHPGELGYETWPRTTWTYSGSANNWAGMSVDLKREIVFVPTGSAASDFYGDRKSTRLNSSHQIISYAVFCLKKKKVY